jgi:hypothetical protein
MPKVIYNIKSILYIFLISFFLNLIWENLHSFLYDNYKGGVITQSILLHATFIDALMITLIILPFILFPNFKRFSYLIILIGITLAVSIELWALGTSRWEYNSYMPIIPFLSVGLTPTIQLGFLGYISFIILNKSR